MRDTWGVVINTRCRERFTQVGKLDAKKHLEAEADELLSNSILQTLGAMLATRAF